VAALELDDPTTTPQPTPTSTPTATVVTQETPDPVLLTPAGPIRHKVKPGDNPSTIAALYGSNVNDILQANSLSAKAVLSIGQEL
jgi:LysM repeat protein